jgi:hypothetical protein
MSHAMVMCASTPEKVEILTPPSDSKPGDKVTIEGFIGTPDQQLNPKKKVSLICRALFLRLTLSLQLESFVFGNFERILLF